MKLTPIEGRRLYPTIAIFGMAGVGKTTVAATAPKPLVADSDEGTLAIADIPQLAHMRRTPIMKLSDLDTLYDNITGTGTKDWSRFKTVIFDDFTSIQHIILDQLAERASQSREEPDQIELREYGIMGNKLRRYLRKMKRLPVTKILIMGEKPSDAHGGMMMPNLVGQMKEQLPYIVDHTFYLRANDKGVRYLHLNPKPGAYYAKTRARWLSPEQRKIRVDLDDYTLITRFLAMIAKGPQPARSK